MVAERRAERTRLTGLRLPSSWRGRPTPLPDDAEADPGVDGEALVLTGIAVSGGVVEGPVRVVLNPDFDDV